MTVTPPCFERLCLNQHIGQDLVAPPDRRRLVLSYTEGPATRLGAGWGGEVPGLLGFPGSGQLSALPGPKERV